MGVKFIKPYGAYNPGDVAGWPRQPHVEAELIAAGICVSTEKGTHEQLQAAYESGDWAELGEALERLERRVPRSTKARLELAAKILGFVETPTLELDASEEE